MVHSVGVLGELHIFYCGRVNCELTDWTTRVWDDFNKSILHTFWRAYIFKYWLLLISAIDTFDIFIWSYREETQQRTTNILIILTYFILYAIHGCKLMRLEHTNNIIYIEDWSHFCILLWMRLICIVWFVETELCVWL